MPVRGRNPITPGLRFRVSRTYKHLSTQEPHKPLTKGKKRISGRAGTGRISVRRRGGGAKKMYRFVDFKRDKIDVPAKIASIEYDPNRSADICLLHYSDGEKRYILAPKGIQVGDTVISAEKTELSRGMTMPLENIPIGTSVHNVELTIGKGGIMARSGGSYATLSAREKNYVTLKLPSGEMRLVHGRCRATIGVVGGEEGVNVSLGKAGMSRILGRRPKVRGVAMNPHDHPHGGGEGKTSGGRHPVSPWGMPTKGYKSRKKRKASSKFIVKRRGR